MEEILAERSEDFDKFQEMKKEVGVREGAAVRFELIDIDPIRENDGMKKVRHSRVRMFQAAEDGKRTPSSFGLDDMFSSRAAGPPPPSLPESKKRHRRDSGLPVRS